MALDGPAASKATESTRVLPTPRFLARLKGRDLFAVPLLRRVLVGEVSVPETTAASRCMAL